LLTGTFQLQRYISANILQPSLELVPSSDRFVLTWDSPFSNLLNVRGENDTTPPGSWRVPTFNLRNVSAISAQDVTYRWTATKYFPSEVVSSAQRFKNAKVELVSGSQLMINTPNTGTGQTPFEFSASTSVAFITKTAEIFIPLNVFNAAAIYFVATMPDQPGAKSQPYVFELSISWNIPDNTRPERFRVTATATNIKATSAATPEFVAALDFAVQKIE
jgi:hypothetical protein